MDLPNLIFYEATSEGILVIRVVHGMREMKDLFPKR